MFLAETGLPLDLLTKSVVAGLLASLACGLGIIPLMIPRLDPSLHKGLGYATAGGLMFAASVYNLILPALQQSHESGPAWTLAGVVPVLAGILLGAGFMGIAEHKLNPDKVAPSPNQHAKWGGAVGLLIFLAMTVHSIPEGVAVGVGYTSGQVHNTGLGTYIAVAIAIHNIPEGLAVAIPMRSSGASLNRCFWAAVLTSLPQPIAAVPAVLASWFFQPIMPLLMGFAAGAMIFLVIVELIPQALVTTRRVPIAWAFTLGFCGMIFIQVML